MCCKCGQEIKSALVIKLYKREFHPECFSQFLQELNEQRRKQAEADSEKSDSAT